MRKNPRGFSIRYMSRKLIARGKSTVPAELSPDSPFTTLSLLGCARTLFLSASKNSTSKKLYPTVNTTRCARSCSASTIRCRACQCFPVSTGLRVPPTLGNLKVLSIQTTFINPHLKNKWLTGMLKTDGPFNFELSNFFLLTLFLIPVFEFSTYVLSTFETSLPFTNTARVLLLSSFKFQLFLRNSERSFRRAEVFLKFLLPRFSC